MRLLRALHTWCLPRRPDPRPALFLAQGRVAAPADGVAFNATLCDCGAGSMPGPEHRSPGEVDKRGCPAWRSMVGGQDNSAMLAYTRHMLAAAERRPDTGVLVASMPRPGPMHQVVAGRVVTDQEAAILMVRPSGHQSFALFGLYEQATRMIDDARHAADKPQSGDRPECRCLPRQYPETLREIRAYRRAQSEGRCTNPDCPGAVLVITSEQVANGIGSARDCVADLRSSRSMLRPLLLGEAETAAPPVCWCGESPCTTPDDRAHRHRRSLPPPTPIPGPGRKQSR